MTTNLIKSLVLTNKSVRSVVENNQYILNVDQKLKKPEIKKLCQEIFNTKIVSVNTYNLPPKKRHTKMKRVFVKFVGPEGKDNPLDNFVKFISSKEKNHSLDNFIKFKDTNISVKSLNAPRILFSDKNI